MIEENTFSKELFSIFMDITDDLTFIRVYQSRLAAFECQFQYAVQLEFCTWADEEE